MRLRESILPVIAVFVVAFAAACGSGEDSAVGSQLTIFTWDDYFPPSTVQNFEAEFGIDVVVETFDSSDEVLAAVQSDPSRYDVVWLSHPFIAQMTDLRLLAELDQSNIPNLANVDPSFLDQPWDPGNRYSVPYTWGSTGIIYNRTYVPEPGESWALLRDPKLAGRVALLDEPQWVVGLTLKSLGYPLNSADLEQVAEAVQLLQAQRPLLAGFFDPITIREKMTSEELWAAQLYNGDAAFAMADSEDMGFFIPAEGSDIWFDNLAIPRDTKNKAGAELFLDYILRPDVHAEISNYTGYAVPNKAAVEQGLIDEALLASEVSYPARDALESWIPMDGERLALWNRAWAEAQRGSARSSLP